MKNTYAVAFVALWLTSLSPATADVTHHCVGTFQTGVTGDYRLLVTANSDSDIDPCKGSVTYTCPTCPFNLLGNCNNACSSNIDVSCWPSGAYTVTWTGACSWNYSGLCEHSDNPEDPVHTTQITTFTVPQRQPSASVSYDPPNQRLVITYAFATPHFGAMNLYVDGDEDDSHAVHLGSNDCGNQQSGVCYYAVAAPVCFFPHKYKLKIRDCVSDPWTPGGVAKAAALGCVDFNNTNCKQDDDVSKSCPINNDNCPGAPVNIGSGDVSLNIPLFTIAQSPMPLSFDLTYHSLAPSHPLAMSTTISSGWTHTFNASLRPSDTVNEPGRLLLVTPHGQRYYFDKVTNSLWIPVKPLGSRNEIVLSGAEYILEFLDGSETHFDTATGRWNSSRDRWGNTITGTYSSGLLTTITDSEGRNVTLTYQGTALTTIQLPTGETWTLGYGNGKLTSITDPVASSAWRTFAYQTDSHGALRLLTSMRDAGNVILEQHDYDSNDRGTTSIGEGGRDAYTIQYDAPAAGQVTITHNVDATTTRVSTVSLLKQNGQYLPTEVDGVCPTCGGSSNMQSYTYDSIDQPITRVDGVGIITNYSYDGYGNIILKTENAGSSPVRQTSYRYDYPAWPTFLTQEIDPPAVSGSSGPITTYTWSGTNESVLTATRSGHVIAGDARTTYTSTSTFDLHHRLLSVDGPRSTTPNDASIYTYFGDNDTNVSLRGRLNTITNALNQTTTLGDYDVFGTPRSSTDPNGVITLRATDARGRTTSVTNQAIPSDPNETNDYQTSYTFDSRDRLTEVISPRGLHTRYAYEDGSNRLTDTTLIDLDGNEHDRRHVGYDLAGEKIVEQDETCDVPTTQCAHWSVKRDESYKYDSNARLIEVDHLGGNVHYGYDADGRLTSVQDENHSAANTTYAYDAFHRLTSVVQKLGNGTITTAYGYDDQHNLTSVIDPNGNQTTYAYDDFGRLQSQQSPVTGTTAYTYDEAGNLITSTDSNSAVTTRTYDALNRVVSAASTGSAPTENVTWAYDTASYGVGRLATMTDPTGSTSYAYERRGFLLSEQKSLGGATYTTSYGFDKDGNRTSITYPTGAMLTYTYDFADRPFSIYWPALSTTIVAAAAYYPFGPASTIVYGNGTTRTMTYDSRYRMSENKLNTYSGTTIADYQYSQDAGGNITAIHDGTDAGYDRTFAYDDLNRLVTAGTGSLLWQDGSYEYDAMGNLTKRTFGKAPPPDDGTMSGGRRASPLGVSGQVEQLFLNYQGTTPKLANVRSTSLPPDDGSILSLPRRHGASATATNELMRSVQYDAAGNETQYFVQRVYSARNLLASVIDNSSEDGTHHIDYGYDGRGVRVSRTEAPNPNGTATRYYVYSPELQLLEITDDDQLNVWSQKARTLSVPLTGNHLFVWFNGQPVAEWGPPRTADSVELSRRHPATPMTATSLFLTFSDHLGTPLLQFNILNEVLWRAEYEPYGNVWTMRKGSRGDQPLRLPGQDVAMTWEGGEENYNIFRWYRAGWGRYTQADPLSLVAFTPDRERRRAARAIFEYGFDNPLHYTDRLGLKGCPGNKCKDDCPSGDWVGITAGWSGGILFGKAKFESVFFCTSSGNKYCNLESKCTTVGLQAGASWNTTFSGFTGCKCAADIAAINSSLTIGPVEINQDGPCKGLGFTISYPKIGEQTVVGSVCETKVLKCYP